MENSTVISNQQKQSPIETLPNEIIYNIFNFLTTFDVVRGFTLLNHRFDTLVQFHVKEIDLTDSWQGNQQYLHRICETIQTLKIDRYHTYLLTSSSDRTNFTAGQRNDKHLLQSMIRKITTTIQCRLFRSVSASIYRFPALQSLHLVNISNWNNIISDMNLANLNLWFDDDIHYFNDEIKIPTTIIRFTANAVLDAHCFHLNLIDLNVYICSFSHLIEIV
ncbi:unnamed protein product [Adineta ricciae]|uniref:F-box domain-containing protein n=1 Tax=Adineta ricciae TaxID=249248 RepID=A0A815VZT1_ADIRI|nr:unnamed protein product [Adineta ricciae]